MAANACAQKPMLRPEDGQQTVMWQQTVMREEYAETAVRGMGLLQRFVSAFSTTIYHIIFALFTPYCCYTSFDINVPE